MEELRSTYEDLCLGPLTPSIFDKILIGDISDIEEAFKAVTKQFSQKEGLTSNYYQGIIRHGRAQQLQRFKSEALLIAVNYPSKPNSSIN